MSELEKPLFAGLLTVAILVPLAMWPGLVDATLLKDAVFFLAVGALLLGASIFGFKKGFAVDRHACLILGFLALVSVSTWFSVHRETSIIGAHRLWLAAPAYVGLAATYFVALQIKWDRSRMRGLIVALVCVAAVSSLFALVRFGQGLAAAGVIVKAAKARALFPGSNAFAFFLMAVFPLALRSLFEPGKGKAERALFAIGSILIFAANVTVLSRTGWIVSMAVLFAVLLMSGKKALALALVVVLAAVVLAAQNADIRGASLKSYTARRLTSIFQSSSLGPRVSMWQAAKDLTLDKPWTGHGPDTFSLAVVGRETLTMAGLRNKPRAPHNFTLYISSTLGLPAFILLFFIFLRSIGAALAGGDYLKQTLGLSMAAMIILSQALIWHPYMMLPFWLFMAAVSPDRSMVGGRMTSIARPAAAAAALLIVGWIGLLGVADRYYVLGTGSQDRGEAQAYLGKAVAINPYTDIYWRALFRKARNEAFAQRLSVVSRARGYYPASEEPLYLEATLRYENREPAEALRLVDKALKIRPFYTEARLLKAKTLARLGRFDEAQKELALAKRIKTVKSKLVRQTIEEINQPSSP